MILFIISKIVQTFFKNPEDSIMQIITSYRLRYKNTDIRHRRSSNDDTQSRAGCSMMPQKYNPIARGDRISLQIPLFNLALTCRGATGAYLRHAVVEVISPTPAQLRKCRVVMDRHATSWFSVGRSKASAHRLCEAEHHTAHHRAKPPQRRRR